MRLDRSHQSVGEGQGIELLFHGGYLSRGFSGRVQDGTVFNRNGASFGVLPFGKSAAEVPELQACLAAVKCEDLAEEQILGLRQLGRVGGGEQTDIVVGIRLRHEAPPELPSPRLRLGSNEFVDVA